MVISPYLGLKYFWDCYDNDGNDYGDIDNRGSAILVSNSDFVSLQLDAKKSPLALLAQTCSNIGMDSPNHKPMLSVNSETKSKKSTADDRKKSDLSSGSLSGLGSLSTSTGSSNSSSNDSEKSQPAFKPYDLNLKKSPTPPRSELKDEDRRSRSSPLSQRSPRTSPAVSEKSDKGGKSTPKGGASSPAASITSAASVTSSSTTTLSGLGYPGLEHLSRGADPKESLAALHLAYKNLAAAAGHPMAGAPSPLAAGHHPLDLKGLPSPYAPVLSSYAGYARVKTPSGGVSLVPVCRDPLCSSCQLSMQSAQLAPCPSGCTSCTHERVVPPAIPFLPGLHGSSALFPTYPTHPLAGRTPNVCSWMVGDSYCGKRFSSSEELLAHLRTHTTLPGGDLPHPLLTPPGLSPFGGSTTSPPLAAPLTPLAPLPPPPTSSASLRRSYPSPSLSPIGSSTSSAAARFHPYSSPPTSKSSSSSSSSTHTTGSSLSTSSSSASSTSSTTTNTPPTLTPPLPAGFPGAPFPPLPHPSAAALSMFSMYNPYAMYGQRLGPPVHP